MKNSFCVTNVLLIIILLLSEACKETNRLEKTLPVVVSSREINKILCTGMTVKTEKSDSLKAKNSQSLPEQ